MRRVFDAEHLGVMRRNLLEIFVLVFGTASWVRTIWS